MPCSPQQFTNFLINQQPHYSKEILKTITPQDGWVGHVSTGTYEPGTGTIIYQDTLEGTYADTTAGWTSLNDNSVSCGLSNPCDPTRNLIGYGASRRSFSPETQSWRSQMFCYDQMMSVSHAKESIRQLVDNILKPATNTIYSSFIKKRALFWLDKKIVANATMAPFAYVWSTDGSAAAVSGGAERFLLSNQMPTSKLTPQMLQLQVQPLIREGYFGVKPYEGQDMLPLLELVTDLDTSWELQRLGGLTPNGNGPNIAANWRFEMWDAASKFWRYGLYGQIGNFAIRLDTEQMRFNYAGASGNATYPYRFQVVQAYTNVASSGAGGAPGIMRIPNAAYDLAQFRITFIWNKKAMEIQTLSNVSINPEMPFLKRDFGGNEWRFVMHDLTEGCDVNGNPIAVDNSDMNKGRFQTTFKLAMRPRYTKYGVVIFHKGEPMCALVVPTCNPDPGYSAQQYSSANVPCVP